MATQDDAAETQARLKFYVAKVQQKALPHDLLCPITLYAEGDASAEAAVYAMSEVAADDQVTVRAIRALHEPFFGRSRATDWDACSISTSCGREPGRLALSIFLSKPSFGEPSPNLSKPCDFGVATRRAEFHLMDQSSIP